MNKRDIFKGIIYFICGAGQVMAFGIPDTGDLTHTQWVKLIVSSIVGGAITLKALFDMSINTNTAKKEETP